MKAFRTAWLIASSSLWLLIPVSMVAQQPGLNDPTPESDGESGSPPPEQPVDDGPQPPEQPVDDGPPPPEQPEEDGPPPPEQPVDDGPQPLDQPGEDGPPPPEQAGEGEPQQPPEQPEADEPRPPEQPGEGEPQQPPEQPEADEPRPPQQPGGEPSGLPDDQSEPPDRADPVPPSGDPELPQDDDQLDLPDGEQPIPPEDDFELDTPLENEHGEWRSEFSDELKMARDAYDAKRKVLRDLLMEALDSLGDTPTKEQIEAAVSAFRAEHGALIMAQKTDAEAIKQAAKEVAESGTPTQVAELREVLNKARVDREAARDARDEALRDAGPAGEEKAIQDAFRNQQRDQHELVKEEIKRLRGTTRQQAQDGDRRND